MVNMDTLRESTTNFDQQEVIATAALDQMGQILREKGLTLEELMESGREVRSKLLEKEYGLKAEEE